MYSGDFEQWKSTENKAAYSLNDAVIYQRLMTQGLMATAEEPCFRFYHLGGVHSPYLLDRDLNYISDGSGTEEEQGLGTLHIISEYIKQLKSLGVYNQTTVIILADHGYHEHSYMESCPLLMIKFPGQSHPFTISDIPISYVSMAEIMTEYMIDSPGIGKEMKPTGIVYHGDTLHKDRNYALGTEVFFDAKATAGNYQVAGFYANEGYYTWTSGNNAELLFELPEPPKELEMILEYGTYYGEQCVNVWVNGKLVDIYYANGDTVQYVTIPEGTVAGKEMRIKLELPDACSPAEIGQGEDTRQLALSMRSIVIKEVEDEH